MYARRQKQLARKTANIAAAILVLLALLATGYLDVATAHELTRADATDLITYHP